MTINLSHRQTGDRTPLYLALADAIEIEIREGRLKPGDRLPTHRELADELGINVSTVTRGYKAAEERGIVSGTVGRGTFVSSDALVDKSMVGTDSFGSRLLEMGLVTPLHTIEPDVPGALKTLAKSEDLSRYLQYTSPEGLPEHRAAGVEWARQYAIKATVETTIVCAGAQHALTTVLTTLFQHGDTIAVDSLTYPGIKSLATSLGLRLMPVGTDLHGMLPVALDVACRRNDIAGLYLMPTMQNPTTTCMPDNRRDAIAAIAEKHHLLLIEDDAYALTRQSAPIPLSGRMQANAISICGVSKAFAAGLRIAFMVAPRRLIPKLRQGVLNTIWMAPTLNAALVSRWILDGTAATILDAKKKEASRRYTAAKTIFKGVPFQASSTGYFLWLPLPQTWTGSQFEARCREVGINVFCAEKFAVGAGAVPPAIRISLTGSASVEQLSQALHTIRQLLTETPIQMPVL